MSDNLHSLNNLYIVDDKLDDLLEQKIRENEANIQALENINISYEKSNNYKNEENQSKDAYNSNIGNDIYNSNVILLKEENKLNENDNSYFNKNNENINLSNIINSNINMNNNNIKINKNRNIKRNNKKKLVSFLEDNFLSSNDDQSLLYQYTTLFSCQNIKNNSSLKRNTHKNKKQNDKYKNNSMDRDIDINEDKFSIVYKRFLEDEKKKKEKLEKIKRNNNEQENKKYSYKPHINKKSIELSSKNKQDFYSRQKKLMEEQNKKEALLREKIRKKEQEEIDKTKILLSHNFSTVDGNKKITNKRRKQSVDETINKLYEWDIKRKEKINNKIKNKEKSMENIIQKKPEKNKLTNKIKVNRNPNKLINRLYKDDIAKRKEKQEILSQVYKPSFKPLVQKRNICRINHNKNNSLNINKNNNKNNKNKTKSKVSSFNFITNNFIENLTDEDENHNNEYNLDVNDLIRRRILSKINNKTRHNSIIRFNIKKSESMNNDISNIISTFNNDNSYINYYNNIDSSCFLRKNKKGIHYD